MCKVVIEEESLLGKKIASLFNQKENIVTIKSFADTESFIKFDNIGFFKNKNIFLIKQFVFNKNSLINDQFFKLLLSVYFLKKAGAKKIVGVLPYLSYSRHDKGINKNNDGAIYLIGKLLQTAGVSDLVCLELHAPNIKENFAINLHEITLQNFWSEHIKKISSSFGNMDFCIVSPDRGGRERVKKIAKILNKDFFVLEKKRIAPDQPIVYNLDGNFKNKIAIIVDDILDTGKTAMQCCDVLLKNGAKKVVGCFTHAVFAYGTLEKIENSRFEKVFVTDTVVSKPKFLNSEKILVLSISNLLYKYLEDRFI
ncbi:ribose-phosphate diphosphokinase [Candidatus Dependentiae bacterium]